MDLGDRVAVGDGSAVQGPIVPTGAPVTSGLLRHHMKRRGPCTRRGAYDPQL